MKIRHSLTVLATISILLFGCGIGPNDMGAKGPLKDFPPEMDGFVKVEGKTYEMTEGNSRWERKKGMGSEIVTTDAPSPSQLAEEYPAIKIEPKTNISIEIEEDPKQQVYLWTEENRDKEINIESHQFIAPSSKGRYVYEVMANWEKGEVSYTFAVEVE